ncbi:DNA-binding protein [Pseudomonas carassii]|uniref:DNA-binding protein n=1 Tax=Pseudomonas carassii TaxID=3115855 RepID=A0ABU7HCZ4_9PSED|nr:DNA-binding protein [Pseudomonas sp. 137P]MEE1889071.1 DNA-binding protein [Pseudomonas sp. 137P]
MARIGIDKASVQQARQALMARGEHPSIDAVRIELGNTGSKTTIHRYLKELERQSEPMLGSTVALSEPLSRLVERLAVQLQEEGQARIDAAEAAAQARCAALQAQLLLAERDLASALRQVETLSEALHVESERLAASQASLQAEQLRSASLNQSQGELQARLADKEEQLRTSLEQRQQEQRRSETQVRQLQGQLQTLQQGAIARQDELTRLHRDNERLLVEQRQATAQSRLLDEQLQQRDAQVQGLRAILAQAQGANDEMRRQLATRQNLDA